jgi:integrase
VFHGLRHTCAAEWYVKLTGEGMSDYQARKQVSKWLGHERPNITDRYLTSVRNTGSPDESGEDGDSGV